ncbi:hypothetical protein PVAND_002644 [Polypedilum vanderplanki]|uniref:Uncharacterized protein n=1 Tax=Polypedilum vanderplanki TaxID=319348 RepID=A0A9J6BRL3_POLVA|nr:hypothetical protein PVAND_002644 [Polypedilum vanderplanki]
MDFSENFCVKQQNEIQSAYYSRDQFTLFTAVAYIYLDELKTISYGIVSNTRNHDKYSTNSMKQAILEDLMESYTNIEEIWWFSDGAPAHFKNYYSLSNMTKLAKEYRIKMQWSFSATSHGKSQADGVGGSIKAMIDRRLKTKEIEIKNAKDFYINAKETCPVHKILYVSQREIDALRDNLDKFWSNAKKIVDLRQFHHFECCENDEKTLKCAITSTGIGQKLVKILK